MVQAILAGRKTQTRRIMKHQPIQHHDTDEWGLWGTAYVGKELRGPEHDEFWPISDATQFSQLCPYGEYADVLWVREGFTWLTKNPDSWVYRADPDNRNLDTRWKPSIHMPKAACRLFLEITKVRVERLQDISEEDAIKEGIEYLGDGKLMPWKDYMKSGGFVGAKTSFQSLWAKINGIKSWDTNPWVWVVEFELADDPEEIRSIPVVGHRAHDAKNPPFVT